MTTTDKEKYKQELAQYAVNLTQIYNYLRETSGSADPYHKQFTISCEIDSAIKKLLKAIKGGNE